MKKITLLALFAIIGIIITSFTSGSKQASVPNPEPIPRATEVLTLPELEDKVGTSQSSVRPPVILKKDQKKKNLEEEVREKILLQSGLKDYKNKVINGMQASFKNNDKVKKEKLEKFSQALADYPLEEEFSKLLKNYNQEELDYLLGNMNHPANITAKEVQNKRIDELTKVTLLKEAYQPDEEKKELISNILEETQSYQMAMAISEAMTTPIFMLMYKQKNPTANQQEMLAYAQDFNQKISKSQSLTIQNVLNWSYAQVSTDELQSLSEYVGRFSDKNINEKYLKDLKKFYGKYGRYIGENLQDLY